MVRELCGIELNWREETMSGRVSLPQETGQEGWLAGSPPPGATYKGRLICMVSATSRPTATRTVGGASAFWPLMVNCPEWPKGCPGRKGLFCVSRHRPVPMYDRQRATWNGRLIVASQSRTIDPLMGEGRNLVPWNRIRPVKQLAPVIDVTGRRMVIVLKHKCANLMVTG